MSESRLEVTGAWEWGWGMGSDCFNGNEVSLSVNEKVLKRQRPGGCIALEIH